MEDEPQLVEVGALKVSCQICNDFITVPIKAGIREEDGKHYVTTDADVADLWAHSFVHKDDQ